MVDLYCERLAPGIWAEPVNTTTNLAFFIAAWATWRMADRLRAFSAGIWLLSGLICAIGLGSSLFHLFATSWARILDMGSILLFQLVYVWLYCHWVVHIRFAWAGLILTAYTASLHLGIQLPHRLSGSLIYAPTLVVLLALGVYHCRTHKSERFLPIIAAAVFSLALIFRSIDEIICPYFPFGSHFLWHILAAIVLYVLTKSYLANLSIPRRSEERLPS